MDASVIITHVVVSRVASVAEGRVDTRRASSGAVGLTGTCGKRVAGPALGAGTSLVGRAGDTVRVSAKEAAVTLSESHLTVG